jgi:hypothetical protein
METHLRDYRCKACGRLLLRGYLPPGTNILIRCWHRKCAADNEIKPGAVMIRVKIPTSEPVNLTICESVL